MGGCGPPAGVNRFASRLFSLLTAAWAAGALAESPSRPAPPPAPAVARAPLMASWQPIFVGVEKATLSATSPRPMRGAAVRIDLKAPGIAFFATPGNGEAAGETTALKTSGFLEKYRLQAAVNAAPFDVVYDFEGGAEDVKGLLVSEGAVISAPQSLPALLIGRKNRAWVARAPVNPAGAWNAVGGFAVILEKGRVIRPAKDPLHPRTVAGVSKEGRYLYWLAIDGRQPGRSDGAKTAEAAEWLLALGAWDGLNLDGGGTTTLCVARPGGAAETLNRPIHRSIPGWERPAGCHLGVRALPLPRNSGH